MSDFTAIICLQSVQKRAKRGKAELFRAFVRAQKCVLGGKPKQGENMTEREKMLSGQLLREI